MASTPFASVSAIAFTEAGRHRLSERPAHKTTRLRNGRIAGLRAEPSGLGRHRGEGGVHCTRRQEGSPKPEWERCHDHVYVTITNDTGAGSLRQVEAADKAVEAAIAATKAASGDDLDAADAAIEAADVAAESADAAVETADRAVEKADGVIETADRVIENAHRVVETATLTVAL